MGRSLSSGPTRWTRTPYWRAARTAPRTSGSGALSEPIASTTMSVGIRREEQGFGCQGLACFFGHDNIAALVLAALTAGTVGQLALVAVRALGEAGGGKKVVAAAIGSSLLRVAPFWIKHCGIPFNRPRRLRETTRSTRQKLDFHCFSSSWFAIRASAFHCGSAVASSHLHFA